MVETIYYVDYQPKYGALIESEQKTKSHNDFADKTGNEHFFFCGNL